jgi:N-acetylglucosaminyldiphosphoundecaprenol N-acetyl-beta-D-mannosaminyltransferase
VEAEKSGVLVTASDREPAPARNSYRQLGVRVDVFQIPEVIAILQRLIAARGRSQYVSFLGMHSMTESQRDPELKDALNGSALAVADGMPLVWLGRYHGFAMKRRVYGPELMLKFCEVTASQGVRHFFYGGAEGVPQALAATLKQDFPGLVVAGCYSPPFRPLTEAEETEVTTMVSDARADILWVGLGAPKQEKWMHSHTHLDVPVMAGVGAAFDLNTGRLKQAPRWMQESGFEWFFRLCMEPKRLWRRYLLLGPKFVFYLLAEITGLRKFD